MRNVFERREIASTVRTAVRRLSLFASVCGLALAMTALPVTFDGDNLVPQSAFAKGGNGGGNGKGNGRGDAPGQQDEAAVNDAEGAAEGDIESAVTDAGDRPEVADTVPLDETAPANVRVIKEIAGLNENSELSDEEELEAIRNGWGTWRTADGPDSVTSQ